MIARAGRLTLKSTWERQLPSVDCLPAITTALQLPSGTEISRTGLILPSDLDLDDWKVVGQVISDVNECTQWWLGDWWHYGDHTYGKRARAVAEGIFGNHTFGTMKTYGWVAGAVERSIRIDVLSFAHHALVAKYSPEEQTKWLSKAARGKWSVSHLRQAIYDADQRDLDDLPEDERRRRLAERRADYLQRVAEQKPRSPIPIDEELAADVLPYLDPIRIADLGTAVHSAARFWNSVAQAISDFLPEGFDPERDGVVQRGVRSSSGDEDDSKRKSKRKKRPRDTSTDAAVQVNALE
jgi:hypothetical protein